jgi:solute:Na+ symporter, SSS family
LAGYSFPGYSALYTVILNLVLVVVLTPVFNALGGPRQALDETVPTDYAA